MNDMKLNPIAYVKESKNELKRIVWPTRKETLRFTVIVIIATVLVGAYIAGLDYIFAALAEKFIYR